MKYFIISICMACSFTLLGGATACSPDDTGPITENPTPPDNNGGNNNGNNSGNPEEPDNTENMKLQIKIGETVFTATFRNNVTATAFKAMLPLTLHMGDMNRNEKFIQLPNSLPTAASNPGTIHTGDLMLYGSAGLVLFYKTFDTSYSYTPIGTIDNPTGLETAVGTGSVTVVFEEVTKE